MTSPKSDIVCQGCWQLGNNCEQMADACEKAGKFAHWAQSEIRRLEAELADRDWLVAHLHESLARAMDRIAAQSELLSKRAETKRSELPLVIEPEPHQASKEVETDHLSNPTGDMPAPPFHVVPVRLVKADPPDSWPLPPGPVDLLTMMRNDKCIVKAGGFSRVTDTSDWAALPEEPCRFCRVPGGVVFLIDDGPPGRESPVIVRCRSAGGTGMRIRGMREGEAMSKSEGFIEGYEEAERQMYQIEDGSREWYTNPFDPNNDAHRGFEEEFYDFTQK